MARGTVNKVILVGRLGNAIELRYLPSGTAVANISIATNEDYKDAQTGQLIDSTQWHRVVVFGKLAETMKQYLHKGDLVYIDGRIRTTKYQDKVTGQDRYATDIIVNNMQMLGGKTDHSNPMPDYVPPHINVIVPNAASSDRLTSE
ncbi:single-stranded DNA-binding protein [Cysteiniphilum litorale]|uniref:single-stranded DNA-binding protein n=1 Tax=Cysteiniphilum litorale TaxID=2056700 RepID=UPI003F88197A